MNSYKKEALMDRPTDISYGELPDIIDTQMAADYLGLARETVQVYAREGRLRAARCGKTYRIRKAWLLDFLEDEADRNVGR